MFNHMYEDPHNNLASKFEAFGLNEKDRTFIKEQIAGPFGEGNDVRLLIIDFIHTKYKVEQIILNWRKKLLPDTG